MRYHIVDLNGKELKFRLTVDDIESIENRKNVKMLDFIQDYSITTTVFLLQHMYKDDTGKKLSHDEAQELLEEFFDNGWALQKVAQEVIWPTCVVSGLLTESDLNRALSAQTQATQK